MRVTFITIEDVASGLFRTQVLDLARTVARLDPAACIRILAVNRPWKAGAHRAALRTYRELLSGSRVRITYVPLLPPLRGAVDNPLLSELLVALLRFCLKLVALFQRVDVWHARGYWAAMALQRDGRRSVLFDPRSLWVLENQSAGNLTPGSRSSTYWLKNEKAVTEWSHYVAVVSRGMKTYYDRHYRTSSVGIIPISANEAFFRFDTDARARRRRELGWQDQVVFVYSGSLGLSGINVTALAELFRFVLGYADARLLILTDEPQPRVLSLLSSVAVPASRFVVIRPGLGGICEWLGVADVGLHALPKQLDSDTRLGTKVVEYWASGLPVVVNCHVGAAVDYIRENPYLGRSIDFERELPAIETVVNEVLDRPRALIQTFARANFSGDVVAAKFAEAYRHVAQQT